MMKKEPRRGSFFVGARGVEDVAPYGRYPHIFVGATIGRPRRMFVW